MDYNENVISDEDFFFQHYDNLSDSYVKGLSLTEFVLFCEVLDFANGFDVDDGPDPGTQILSCNLIFDNITCRGNTSVDRALLELKKNKENCNWRLHDRCTRRFLKCHDGYVYPPTCHHDLDQRVRSLRFLIVLFPCDLAFATLDRVVKQHYNLIGLCKNELVGGYHDCHEKYLADGGWCSEDDYDDDIAIARKWLQEWKNDKIISKCVEFNEQILDQKGKYNGGRTLGCPSSTRSEISEEYAALFEWRRMHKHDAYVQELIDICKKRGLLELGSWDRARWSVRALMVELRRWKHVVLHMPSPLSFQALEDVMKIHENFLGRGKKLERYKKRGGWMSKEDFDEKTMAAWTRVQVLESRFRNVHVREHKFF